MNRSVAGLWLLETLCVLVLIVLLATVALRLGQDLSSRWGFDHLTAPPVLTSKFSNGDFVQWMEQFESSAKGPLCTHPTSVATTSTVCR